jgi:Cu(I)/Ag(I) efflux system membrane fusion protein
MIDLTKALSPQDGTLYVQHCPMAFNNKGADWISREHDIRNPYFGASMLTCGDVTDTLTNLK